MIATIKGSIGLLAGVWSSAILGTQASYIGPETQIGLGVAVACAGVLLTCTLWLASYYWRQRQMHNDNIKRLKRMERALKKVLEKDGLDFDLQEDEDEDK